MPIFEYRCTICHRVSEVILSSRLDEVECSHCGFPALCQPSAPASMIFKGEGFEKQSTWHAARKRFLDSVDKGEMTKEEIPQHFQE